MMRPLYATCAALLLALPPCAQWFSATMPRHQLLQVPAMVVLGAIAARGLARWAMARVPRGWDAPLLVVAIGTVMFWMIPRSVDLAASSMAADQVMHLSWFLAGGALAYTLPRAPVVARMALGIHGVAMLAAAGLVYTLYPGLICTAYTLPQQHATGRWMLLAAPVLAVLLWVWAVRGMSAPTIVPPAAEGDRPPSDPPVVPLLLPSAPLG